MNGCANPAMSHLIISLVALAAATALPGCPEGTPEQPAAPEPRIPQVHTLILEPQTWRQTLEAYGAVEPAEDVAITVDFSAPVTAVHFEEGQRVEQGQLLVELDSRKRDLRLAQAATAVEETRAGLEEARRDLERRRGLADSGAISREVLDRAEIALRRATARYEDALAAHRLAERELTESRVVSPVSGIVDRRSVEPGETVMPGQLLGSIQAVDRVRVHVYVGEREVNDLRVGAGAEVRSAGAPGRIFRAKIEAVGIKADPRTGNFPVKLTLPNENGQLRPGMTARVRLQGLTHSGTLLIPDNALVDRRRRRVVYVVRDGTAVEVEPLLRASVAEYIPVLEGLKAGDRLVVAGMEQLADGSPVDVIEPEIGEPTITEETNIKEEVVDKTILEGQRP
jgi:RND family efflux transporter MFP subunit